MFRKILSVVAVAVAVLALGYIGLTAFDKVPGKSSAAPTQYTGDEAAKLLGEFLTTGFAGQAQVLGTACVPVAKAASGQYAEDKTGTSEEFGCIAAVQAAGEGKKPECVELLMTLPPGKTEPKIGENRPIDKKACGL